MIIRWLLYLGCWIVMNYVAFAIVWIIATVKCIKRYAPWIDRKLMHKAMDVAVDNMFIPNWGSNKIIHFIGDAIIEPIAWPVAILNNASNMIKDTLMEYERLLTE